MPPTPDRLPSLVLRFRRVLSVAGQLLLVVLSNRLAFWLRFDGGSPAWALEAFWHALPWLIVIRALAFVPFRLYEGLWRYTSIYDLQALIGGVSLSTVAFAAFTLSPLGPAAYPRSIFVIDAMLLTLLLGGIRLTQRLLAEFGAASHGKRVLIFGAGDAAELIVRDIKNNRRHPYHPIGLIDDDRKKLGRRIHGVPVLGTREELPRILKRYRPHEVLIAIPRSDPATIRSIVRAFEPFKIPIKTLPNLHDIIDGKVETAQIRNLSVEDLLTRAPVGLDRRPLHQLIAGRRVMVTGAGGSIGSELCRQIARLKPSVLLMFERYENSLHRIRMELDDQKTSIGLFPIIGDVTDAARVNEVLGQHRPEIIFHAAAHKHVPLMEENPCEAVKNNVRGTRLLAQAADAHGVDRFIMISTDKAVNPTSMMGASKRLSELVVQEQASGSGTSFSIVRFGNVLGSNGSVVPRFMDQIRNGGPVTITHPDMRRFFMLIPEAVQLVLHAASQAESGAIYVLEMGEPVKLVDMARDLIRLSGLVPEDDIKIEYVGLRPGEKLSEELVGPDEDAGPSAVEKILCVRSRHRPPADLFARVESLEAHAVSGQIDAVMASMKELVGLGVPRPEPEAIEAAPRPIAHVLEAPGEQACPTCLSERLFRSRAQSMSERLHKQLTAHRLFRCDACGWRGWLVPAATVTVAPAGYSPTLDLSLLDRPIAPPYDVASPSFSPRNLS
jgi:FlaA1/EpsC-like NDP-sugar epimerase